MNLLDRQTPVEATESAPDVEALFPEARRRERHHRLGIVLLMLIAAGGVGVAVALATGRRSNSLGTVSTASNPKAGRLPNGPIVSLKLAGSLAVGPPGALYVAAPLQHRILVRLTDGQFRVVAGDGKSGFSGDGSAAIDAELTNPNDLTFATSGSLYFVDAGRIRFISRDGTIHTIAGNGVGGNKLPGASSPHIANGARALSVSLGSSPSIALSPGGELYLDTSSQLLRLTNRNRLEPVRTHRISFSKLLPSGPDTLDMSLGPLAVDSHGDLDVAGFNGWAIWQVAPNGSATYAGYARRSGGDYSVLERGPGGAVYGEDEGTIVKVASHRLVSIYKFNSNIFGEYFSPTFFAFAPNGTIYLDEIPGAAGFEAHQQLISRSDSGHVNLLWQENNKAPNY